MGHDRAAAQGAGCSEGMSARPQPSASASQEPWEGAARGKTLGLKHVSTSDKERSSLACDEDDLFPCPPSLAETLKVRHRASSPGAPTEDALPSPPYRVLGEHSMTRVASPALAEKLQSSVSTLTALT